MTPKQLNKQIMGGQHNRSPEAQDVVDSTSLSDAKKVAKKPEKPAPKKRFGR